MLYKEQSMDALFQILTNETNIASSCKIYPQEGWFYGFALPTKSSMRLEFLMAKSSKPRTLPWS